MATLALRSVVLVAELPVDGLGQLGRHGGREATTGAQHAHHLVDRGHIVLNVLEHLGGDDGIERVVGEREPSPIAAQDTDQPLGRDLTGLDHRRQGVPGLHDLVGGVVEGDHARLAAGALVDVAAEAGPDVEHAVARAQPESFESDRQHQIRPLRRSLVMFWGIASTSRYCSTVSSAQRRHVQRSSTR